MNFSSTNLSGAVIGLTYPITHRYSGVNHLIGKDIYRPVLANQVYNFAKSWFQEACYFVCNCYNMTKEYLTGTPVEYVIPSGINNHWKKGNRGLYVAIHGLNGRPNIWHHQLAILQKHQSDFEIRVPYVPQKGNCFLDMAVAPIEAMVRDYINQHPGQPVCLMGVSNGARIALELEVRLRNTNAPIKISSVAGALFGTMQINLLHMLGLATFLYKPVLVNEMFYLSHTSFRLFNRVAEALPQNAERAYEFYASPDDFQIKPYTGSLPVLSGKDVKYFLVPGENHNSIVARVCSIQIQSCINWMQTRDRKK
jgi:hypothetical protein